MHETISTRDPVALLVDAENLSHSFAQVLLDQARLYGVPTVRRAYGKASSVEGWEEFGYRLMPTRPGRNSADLLLCAQAMTLALHENFHTLLIASSDGGFAYVVEQLRELGHEVIGLGGQQTQPHYRKTCTRFVELRLLGVEPSQTIAASPIAPIPAIFVATQIVPLIRSILPRSNREGKWGTAKWIEAQLKLDNPDFLTAQYGHPNLESLLRAVKYFRLDDANAELKIQDPHPKELPPPPIPSAETTTIPPVPARSENAH